MKRQHFLSLGIVVVAAFTTATLGASEPEGWVPIEVRGGTIAFEADTNIPAVSVHGRSSALQGSARVHEGSEGLVLEGLDATLPVQSLETGVSLRDEHMRRYIFTTGDGKTPDLHFKAEKATCASGGSGQAKCKLSGMMTIRGADRPFVMDLNVKRAGDSFRAIGDTTVKLSTWAVERPSQFGVRTEDDVRLHLEFVAKPAVQTTAENRGSR